MPHELHKYIYWDQTRTEQGNWPTKTFVNMRFRSDTNLTTMIGLLEIVKHELKKIPYKLHDRVVSTRLEMSPKRKPLGMAHALFYKDLEAVGGDESKINDGNGKIQTSFFVESAIAAKYAREGEGIAGEG